MQKHTNCLPSLRKAGVVVLAAAMTATSAQAVTTDTDATPSGYQATNANFVDIDQERVLDTREAGAAASGLGADGKVGPSSTVTISIADQIKKAGEAADSVNAVVVNLTVIDPSDAGYLTAWGTGSKPLASNVNYKAGDIIANGATLPVDPTTGKLSFFSSAATHLAVDVMGFYTAETKPAKGFTPVAPTRLLDTRESADGETAAPLEAGSTTTMDIVTSYGESRGKVKEKHKKNKQKWEEHKKKKDKKHKNADKTPSAGTDVSGTDDDDADSREEEPNTSTGDEGANEEPRDEDNDVEGPKDDDGDDIDEDSLAEDDEHDKQCEDGDALEKQEVEAVVLNITAVNPEADGYLTVWPGDADKPSTSNVNYAAGSVVANNVIVKVDDSTQLKLFTLAKTHVVVDIVGFYADSDGTPGNPRKLGKGSAVIDPVRVYDSREDADDEPSDKQRRVIKVAGVEGLPENLHLVMANVTVVNAEGDGFATVGPEIEGTPTTSHINYRAGDIRPNGAPIKVKADGTITVYTHSAADVIVDVVGYKQK